MRKLIHQFTDSDKTYQFHIVEKRKYKYLGISICVDWDHPEAIKDVGKKLAEEFKEMEKGLPPFGFRYKFPKKYSDAQCVNIAGRKSFKPGLFTAITETNEEE